MKGWIWGGGGGEGNRGGVRGSRSGGGGSRGGDVGKYSVSALHNT